jgi:hypothetical protein
VCRCSEGTVFGERLDLTICQHVAAMGRRVNTLCKGKEGVRQQVVLFPTCYSFVLPHASSRQARLQPLRTNGNSSATLWRPCMPAMSVDIVQCISCGRNMGWCPSVHLQ